MIEYIACIILAFALIQLLVALVNLLFREGLPAREAKGEAGAKTRQTVSLLIPARDEEANIGNLLGDLTSPPSQTGYRRSSSATISPPTILLPSWSVMRQSIHASG